MPSPFPGMDPFLEHPDIFPDFHDSFIAYFRESLQSRLPAPYIAALGRRAWIEVAAKPRTQPVVIRVPHDERREPCVEIYVGRGANRRLVTSIEVLSLANKTSGEQGRDLYLRKQREILQAKVHLVEIDLLRDGEHTTAVPRHRLLAMVDPFDYHVCVHHFDNLEDYFVYTIPLSESLPEIAIPLLPGHPSVLMDLQTVFHRTYDAGPYGRDIDYGREVPVPPLASSQEAWVREILGPRGLPP